MRGAGRILAAALISLAAVASCGKDREELPGYGLRVVELEVEPEHMGEMVSGEQAKVAVPGRALLGGGEYEVLIRPAGKSTLSMPKKNYEIDFTAEGFEGMREIRLSATTADPSMLRSPLALRVFFEAGLPAPNWEFVAVYLNGLYLGLYLRIEKVDEEFLRRRRIPWARIYEAEDGADFEADMPARLRSAFTGVPEPQNLERMLELGRIAAIASSEEFERRVFTVLNRGAVVRYLAACQLTNHYDGFNKNLFYVERADTGLLELVPWDFDFDWRHDLSPDFDVAHRNRLWSRIHNLPSVKAEVAALAAGLARGKASLARLGSSLSDWKSRIRAAWEADPFLGGSGKSLDAATDELQRAIGQRYSRVK